MKTRSYYWILLLVGLVMGVILAVQFRVTGEITNQDAPPLERPIALSQELAKARQERDNLQQMVYNLRERLDKAVAGPELARLKEELDRARVKAGLTEMQGPGIQVMLNDSSEVLQPGQDPNLYVLHDEDVLNILNELKAAGAKAIDINGERVISNTEVRCIGPTILVNKNRRLSPPFVITALGDPDTLANSLQMKGGVIDQLQFWNIQVDVKKMDKVVIPAYKGGLVFNFAKPKK